MAARDGVLPGGSWRLHAATRSACSARSAAIRRSASRSSRLRSRSRSTLSSPLDFHTAMIAAISAATVASAVTHSARSPAFSSVSQSMLGVSRRARPTAGGHAVRVGSCTRQGRGPVWRGRRHLRVPPHELPSVSSPARRGRRRTAAPVGSVPGPARPGVRHHRRPAPCSLSWSLRFSAGATVSTAGRNAYRAPTTSRPTRFQGAEQLCGPLLIGAARPAPGGTRSSSR